MKAEKWKKLKRIRWLVANGKRQKMAIVMWLWLADFKIVKMSSSFIVLYSFRVFFRFTPGIEAKNA